MKNIILFLSFILLISCKPLENKEVTHAEKGLIKIDTTSKGKWGMEGSSVTIKYHIDTLLTEYHEYNFIDKNFTESINHYMDSLKAIRFLSVNLFDKHSNEITKSYDWSDQWNQSIVSIDSIFNKNGILKKIKISIEKEKKLGLEFLVEKEFLNKKITIFYITDFNASKEYLEKGNNYYDRETDIPIKYARWGESYPTLFGRAYKDAFTSFKLAINRIDKKYIDLAKEKYNFDLVNYSF